MSLYLSIHLACAVLALLAVFIRHREGEALMALLVVVLAPIALGIIIIEDATDGIKWLFRKGGAWCITKGWRKDCSDR